MNILDTLKNKVLVYDGSKGVVLQMMGLKGNEIGELWNIEKPEAVKEMYKNYVLSGSDVLQTNTFSGNGIALGAHGLGDKVNEVNTFGVTLAKEVSNGKYVVASLGPTGKMMFPFGNLSFNDAYNTFARQAKILEQAGADAIHCETFMDLSELKCAVLAVKENTSLPVFATMAFGQNGTTLMGTHPKEFACAMEKAGADLIGANCSGGPQSLIGPIKEMAEITNLPLIAKPNAGLPETIDGKSVYTQTPEEFASYTQEFLKCGVKLIGGCCGTTPEFIKALKESIVETEKEITVNKEKAICSHGEYLSLEDSYTTQEVDASDDNQDFITDDAQDACDDCDAIVLNFGDEFPQYDIEEMALNFVSMVKTPVILKGNVKAIEKFARCYPGVVGVEAGTAIQFTQEV